VKALAELGLGKAARNHEALHKILATLRQHGFGAGLTPHRPPLGKMHTLLPLLLDAFSAPPPRGQP